MADLRACAGQAALRDLPEKILEGIFCICSPTSQVSLAQLHKCSGGSGRRSKISEGLFGAYMTSRDKYRLRLHDGAEAIASRISLVMYHTPLETSALSDRAQSCVCVNDDLGPSHLEYILQQQRVDFRVLSQLTVRSIVHNIRVRFGKAYGAGELAGQGALLRLKLYHERQAGLSDDEKLSSFFASLPATFHRWCNEKSLLSACEPVWQLVTPGGTSSSAHWSVAHDAVSVVMELSSPW